MDEIMRELTLIKAAVWVLLGLFGVQITAVLAFLSTVSNNGQKRVIPQLFDFGVKRVRYAARVVGAKLRRPRKSPKDKDLQPLPVPFDEAGFRKFCGALLAAVNDAQAAGGSIEDVKITEGERSKYGLSRDEFIAYRAKLEEKGVVCITDKRGTRGWRTDQNGSYGWARGRLERLAK